MGRQESSWICGHHEQDPRSIAVHLHRSVSLLRPISAESAEQKGLCAKDFKPFWIPNIQEMYMCVRITQRGSKVSTIPSSIPGLR